VARIQPSEFKQRIEKIQEEMKRRSLDGLAVYGDEYRKENLRYVSNFWPIFERGICFIPASGDPILAGAPEGERYAREMSVWEDIRNLTELICVSVPEEIDYPLASFSSLQEILAQILPRGKKLGLIGQWDIPAPILSRLHSGMDKLEITPCDDLLHDLRLIKSEAEIEVLQECGRLACVGYQALIDNALPGNTERLSAGAGQGAALAAGAEAINFMVMGSGPRADTIIGRPTDRIIRDGDMIMASLAVQYEGYVTTVEYPFVAGKASPQQLEFLNILFEAANVQKEFLKPGIVAGEMVKAVKAVFKQHDVSRFDVYPPMHGIGLAEAESPYPDEDADYVFQAGMCVNSDISLFGHPAGSNRIEEGFVIQSDGWQSLTPLVRELSEKGI
jgi:Xaa-Pro aminopeptidase